jgi:predicted transcriptional regulator
VLGFTKLTPTLCPAYGIVHFSKTVIILLKISTKAEKTMATMNFSIPDDIKDRFNQAFHGKNKSAIVAELMVEAIERKDKQERSQVAIDRILERRKHAPVVTEEEIRAAREDLRA